MRIPESCNENESDLDAFVAAAKTGDLAAACELLFINGSDLVWTGSTPGLYVVDLGISEDFEEQYEEAVQLTSARAELGWREFIKRFIPVLADALAQVPRDGATDLARKTALAMEVVRHADEASLEDRIIPLAIGELGSLTDLLAHALVSSCVGLRKRLVNATGMDEEKYADLVYCLHRTEALVGPVLRVAYPATGYHPEISFAGHGLTASTVDEAAHEINVFRLNSTLEAHKRADQDAALPLFISNYLNRHAPQPEKQSYACARYGPPNTPDYDVLVPHLQSGFEVKLYSAPATQTDEKLDPKVRELSGHLAHYSARAKAKVIYYVTNLSREMAGRVVQRARAMTTLPEGTQVIPIAGLEELLPLMRTITLLFEQAIEVQLTGGSSVPPVPPQAVPPAACSTDDQESASRAAAPAAAPSTSGAP